MNRLELSIFSKFSQVYAPVMYMYFRARFNLLGMTSKWSIDWCITSVSIWENLQKMKSIIGSGLHVNACLSYLTFMVHIWCVTLIYYEWVMIFHQYSKKGIHYVFHHPKKVLLWLWDSLTTLTTTPVTVNVMTWCSTVHTWVAAVLFIA